MKLYYSPGACSLATRISLHDAGIEAEFERVDLKAKRTERGDEYLPLNPAGSVPLLVLDDGDRVTENVAILTLVARKAPQLGNGDGLGEIRLIESLSFLSTELHIAFKPFFHSDDAEELAAAANAVTHRLRLIADGMRGEFLHGSHFTVADAYLFVMLRWARGFDIELPTRLQSLFERVAARESVRNAIAEEELASPLVAG